MTDAGSRERVRQATEALLLRGFLNVEPDPRVRVGEPVPVMHPAGGQHSWFVPLVVGPKLVGFAQLLPSLEPLRVSSFQQQPYSCDRCPELSDWIDPDRIRTRASAIARQGEQLSTPVLTYDANPNRLAWKIEATSPVGGTRVLFVAGTAVYEAGRGQGLE